MALRAKAWAYDTSDTGNELQTANAIVIQSAKSSESIVTWSGPIYSRTRTKLTREWINMTEAGAQAVVDTMAGDTNSKFTASEANRILSAYTLTQTVDSRSAYTLDT